MATLPTTKSYMAKPGEICPKWYVVDASDRVLGRLAARIATILMGKHKPTYTPHVDTGDFVVVLNAEKIRVTGKKLTDKEYDWYTRYPGGRKVRTLGKMMEKHPGRVIELAVRRMLPKNRLGRKMFSKLKVYAGAEHPHQAQQPEKLKL
ncbi:MAG: 50S ribosomal protein L13 [Planctomycetes bacterium]|nr:50S ribosomal protein L13 [Planctomycetota bacterium]